MKDSNETIDQFRARLAKVRHQLLKIEPFLSYLSLELPTYILDENDARSARVSTAATDGGHYYFNLRWCRRLTDPELMFVVAHEVGHVMLLHAQRVQERHPGLWNIACDFVINLLLQESKTLKGRAAMPRDPNPIGFVDEKYQNHTAEQVYDKLPKDFEGISWDPMLGGDPDCVAKAVTAARNATARALAKAKEYRHRVGQGNLPSDWERIAEAGLQPTVGWETQLQLNASASGSDTFSWSRPNKKLRPHGFYLPSYRGFQLAKTMFVFDTSGSISDKFLGQMAAELNKLLRTAPRSAITVVTCDTEMHVVGDFSASSPFKPEQHRLPGGGGTDFRPPFEYAQRNRYEQVIYLTDSYGIFPEKPPAGIKSIWLVPAECTKDIPFGQTIYIPKPTTTEL